MNKDSGIWVILATIFAGLGTVAAALFASSLDSVDEAGGILSVIITVLFLLGGLFAQAHEFRKLRQRAADNKKANPPKAEM
jgi:small neutral amino acid transporter SnatA (MarC family)